MDFLKLSFEMKPLLGETQYKQHEYNEGRLRGTRAEVFAK